MKTGNSQKAVLVVEGFLNNGGITTLKLSRSFKLDDTSRIAMVTGAWVAIESGNTQHQLTESGSGTYSANLGSLDPAKKYRLHIKTSNKEYVSDYITVKSTPPIDSINWTRDQKGVSILANTHDPANNSRYYRYEYVETWETRSSLYSDYLYDPAAPPNFVRPRRANEFVYHCWKTQPSTNINLATSVALQNDLISEKALLLIPPSHEKLGIRYSILVKQYVLSKEAYEFFQLMKKNTETMGTIFDPQPSEIVGNIHAVHDKNEPVIGFFYGSSEQQQRIFINTSDVPDWGYRSICDYKIIPPNGDSVKLSVNVGYLPYSVELAGIVILGYKVAEPTCFDCRANGGSTIKPNFW